MPAPASKAAGASALARCGLPPRGLSRVEAAAYVGVSPTLFDRMVSDGRMPRAKRIEGRVVWDRHQLDRAFEALPNDGAADQDEADDVWGKARA